MKINILCKNIYLVGKFSLDNGIYMSKVNNIVYLVYELFITSCWCLYAFSLFIHDGRVFDITM